MAQNKSLAFLERFNYQPKDINYKPFKGKFTDVVIPKRKSIEIPKTVNAPIKSKFTNREYDTPTKFDDYIKIRADRPSFLSYQKRNNLASGDAITDKEGLQTAYNTDHNIYTNGDTLYIAGTQAGKLASGVLPWNWGSGNFSKGAGDVWDDVSKIPFWGDLTNSTRYKEAEAALKANPNIKRVIGHSLGGSVALELQKQYPKLESRTYGAPVWDPTGSDAKNKSTVDRYRKYLAPVSIFDRSSNMTIKTNPLSSPSLTHAFDNIADQFKSGDPQHAHGYSNRDGSISLTS